MQTQIFHDNSNLDNLNIDNSNIELHITSLLHKTGMKNNFFYQRIIRGGNNQAFCIENDAGRFFLKLYFQHSADLRNRLDTEFKFIQFCNEKNIPSVPKALACDVDNGLALYSWVEGTPFSTNPESSDVLEAAIFLKNLADLSTENIKNMPLAAGACFTLSDHINSIEHRLQHVYESVTNQKNPLFAKAQEIICMQLFPLWKDIKAKINSFIITAKDMDSITPWILSPSDFGFHNALKTKDGIVFLDFEYAGRDGIIKTLCDFVCQPEYPVPETAMETLAQTLFNDQNQTDNILLCAKAILPACRLKWCCIMLNQFTKIGANRRVFATDKDLEIQQEIQLQKVQNYLSMHC